MSERRHLMLALLPPILVVLLFAFGVVKSKLASLAAKQEVARLVEQYPLTDIVATRSVAAESTSEQRLSLEEVQHRLVELSLVVEALARRGSAFAEETTEQSNTLYKSDEIWQAKEIIKDVARKAEPFVAEAERLLRQQPHGSIETFDEILLMQLRVAVHENDNPAMLRALVRMYARSRNLMGVSYYREKLTDRIHQTLALGSWNRSEELERLRELMSDGQLLEEQAISQLRRQLAQLDKQLNHSVDDSVWQRSYGLPLGVPGETHRYWVKQLRDVLAVTNGVNYRQRERDPGEVHDVKGSLATMAIVGMPMADCRQYHGSAFGHFSDPSLELARKMTLTAIAVKEFQVKKQRWPTELSELSSLGLSPETWSDERGEPLPFNVNEDQDEATVGSVTIR
jgi:hypothetical protein